MFTCIDVPLSEELKQQYFPFLNENDVEIPVIGLNCGQALAFSITQQSDQAHTVFSSLQPIVAIDYNFGNRYILFFLCYCMFSLWSLF